MPKIPTAEQQDLAVIARQLKKAKDNLETVNDYIQSAWATVQRLLREKAQEQANLAKAAEKFEEAGKRKKQTAP